MRKTTTAAGPGPGEAGVGVSASPAENGSQQNDIQDISLNHLETTFGPTLAPELTALQIMADLILTYRREILAQRRAYKELRALAGSQALAQIYVHQRMREIDESIRRGIETWQVLRYDFRVQFRAVRKRFGSNAHFDSHFTIRTNGESVSVGASLPLSLCGEAPPFMQRSDLHAGA